MSGYKHEYCQIKLYLANLEHGDQLFITLHKTVKTSEAVFNFYNAWIPTWILSDQTYIWLIWNIVTLYKTTSKDVVKAVSM